MPPKRESQLLCPECGSKIEQEHQTRLILQKESDFSGSVEPVRCHEHCAPKDKSSPRIPICKHWRWNGNCVYGNECYFRHVDGLAGYDSMHTRPKTGARQRQKVYKTGRASILRRWLLNTFGVSYLNTGSGVLDIAGGKGELSFELVNLHGIKSTVFDPRALELHRFIRRYALGYYHKNLIPQHSVSGELAPSVDSQSAPDCKVVTIPAQIRRHFDIIIPSTHDESFLYPKTLSGRQSYIDELADSADSNHWGLTPYATTTRAADADADGEVRTCGDAAVDEVNAFFGVVCRLCDATGQSLSLSGPSVLAMDFDKARDIVRDCSVVVGLHPDQVK